MKTSRRVFALCLAATLALAGNSAWAHRSRVGVGVVFGPVFAPAPIWYPSPWYYPPPVVVVPAPQPAPPPVYVEQQMAPESAAQAEPAYWYYCSIDTSPSAASIHWKGEPDYYMPLRISETARLN